MLPRSRFFFLVAPLALGLLLASSKEARGADPFASDPSVDENAAAAASASPAKKAVPTAPSVANKNGPRDSWYGYQTLTIDLPAASLTAIGAFSQHAAGGALAAVGLSAYALGGPIVHWAHGHVGRGFGSLAMRIGIPAATAVTGMVIGFAAHRDPRTEDGVRGAFGWVDEFQAGVYGFIIGGAIGTAGASVIDSLALAREHSSSPSDQPKDDAARPAPAPPQARNNITKPTWQPTFAPTRGGGFQAGVGGTF